MSRSIRSPRRAVAYERTVSSPAERRRSWLPAWIGIIVVVGVVTAHLPVLRNGFLGFDDPIYVSANPNTHAAIDKEEFLLPNE